MNDARSARIVIRTSIAAGWEAAWRNRLAGIALWIFGCAIVAGYYFIPGIHQLLEQVAGIKTRWGLVFSAISTGLFGGLIPSLIQSIPAAAQRTGQPAWLASNTLFWAAKGIEIDLFYRLQALLFGDTVGVSTILLKTAVDQLVYVPTVGLVNVILFFVWRECQYEFEKTRSALGRYWYRQRVLPVLIANWLIWLPAVVLIYCFPLALQLPIQNLILCFWILMLVLLTSNPKQGKSQGQTGTGRKI